MQLRSLRALYLILLFAAGLPAIFGQNTPCRPDMASCPDEGCNPTNNLDPLLNKLKNSVSADISTPRDVTVGWMKLRKNPKHYVAKGPRDELAALGERQILRLTGWLLAVKPEHGESCNCYLDTPADTDNHLVLVTKTTINKFKLPANASASTLKTVFKKREPESVTVEFTPRVRAAGHPKFTNAFVQPILNTTAQGAMMVRITGPLLFDSEHFVHNPLVRVNNWEVHPVYRFEYCPKDKMCTAAGTENWVDLDTE
jgi:hypothetical protein